MISIINVVFPECLLPTAKQVASGAKEEGSHGLIEIEDAILLTLDHFLSPCLDIPSLSIWK